MNLQVGVKVLLSNQEGKILLLRRSEEKYGMTNGQWDIAGGRIDPGSSLKDNLNREVMEETELKLSQVKLIAAQDIMPNDDRHIVRLTYVGRATGEPTLDLVEHSEFKWVTFQELSEEDNLDVFVKDLIQSGLLTESSWD